MTTIARPTTRTDSHYYYPTGEPCYELPKKDGSGMKMDDLYQNKFCGSCHNGQTAFATSECQKCHK